MTPEYEMVLLSDLWKKSREHIQPDLQSAFQYIFQRLEQSRPETSPFLQKIGWIQKIVPLSFWMKLLYRLRYDAMIGFCRAGEKSSIYGMISFQKHPSRAKIGMFDIYISPERRDKDLINHFHKLSYLVYQLTERFQRSRYRYIQCGNNEITRKLLRLYDRNCKKNDWRCQVDVESARIYL